jgi:hypothetical protein
MQNYATESLVRNSSRNSFHLLGTQPIRKEDRGLSSNVIAGGAAHSESSLADIYDPVAMPPDLRKAHQALDKAVDAAYGRKSFGSDVERVAFLFELYHKYTSLLPAPEKPKHRRRKTRRLP